MNTAGFGRVVGILLLAPPVAGNATAQETETPPREVALGSVVTVPVRVPADLADLALAGRTVTFAIRPEPGFRVLGPTTGGLDLRAGDPALLPVTLAVGPDLVAGPANAAVVAFAGPTGESRSATLAVRVGVVEGLRVSLAAPDAPAAPGSRLRLKYEVTNIGNVRDSVSVAVDTRLGTAHETAGLPALAPFETRSGELVIDVAPDATPMPTIVVVRVAGATQAAVTTREIPVSSDEDWLASLVRVPTRLFLGSSVRIGESGPVSPAYGLEAAGLLRPGLRLRLSAHGAPSDGANFAFRGHQYGPGIRGEIESKSLSLAGGDVDSRTAPFAGYRLQGRGATVEAGTDRLRVNAHAARPLGESGQVLGGHQLVAGADAEVARLVVGVRGVDEERRGEPLLSDQRVRAAYLRLAPGAPSRFGFDLDLGWLELRRLSDGRTADGPALSARTFYRDAVTSVDLTVRRRPMLDGMRSTAPDETRLAIVTEAPRDFGLVGQVFRVEGPAPARRDVTRITGGEGGVFVQRDTDRFQLVGRVRRSEGDRVVEEHTVEGSAEAGIGPGSLDARIETGMASVGRSSSVLRAVAGYNLRGERGWGRIGVAYSRDAWTSGGASFDLTGAVRIAPSVELHGSVATSLDVLDPTRDALARVGAQIDLRPDLSVLVGVEKPRSRPGGSDGMRFSVGVQKGLPVPVPFPRQRAVQGVVFEDLDGDGLRSPEEPYLDGVRLTMGGIAINSRRGHFAFPADAPHADVQVEIASLGSGFLPPPPYRTGDGELRIAVHRAASLRVEAFFDANADGVRNPTEMPLPDIGVSISRASSDGWRLRTGSDGAVELTAVRPGSYVVSVDPQTLPRRASAPGLSSMTLLAGQSGTMVLAVPSRTITLLDATPPERREPGTGDSQAKDGGRK